MKSENKNKTILFNLIVCLISTLLSTLDIINSWEYIFSAKFYSSFLHYLILLSILIHPFSLFLYHCISLLYIYYLEDIDFNNLIKEKEFYEMIYFRTQVKNYSFLIIPFALYLTILTYTKFFCFYSLKFLIESPSSYQVFFNVITTTLYNPIFIQIITQTFPQIIMQTANNLLNIQHNHSFHFKGLFNYSTIISILLIINLLLLYFRDKQKFIDADKIEDCQTINNSCSELNTNQSISTINELNKRNFNDFEYSYLDKANKTYDKNKNLNNHYLK